MSLSDKVPGVYLASVSLLKMLAGSRILTARECSAAVADTAPLLIEKVCNPQICPSPRPRPLALITAVRQPAHCRQAIIVRILLMSSTVRCT